MLVLLDVILLVSICPLLFAFSDSEFALQTEAWISLFSNHETIAFSKENEPALAPLNGNNYFKMHGDLFPFLIYECLNPSDITLTFDDGVWYFYT